jgi:Uma2 family endonuclease
MEAILEPILNSPRLKMYVEELQEYLRGEDERRNFFYNTITDKDKAEFINGEIIMHSPVVLAHHNASVLLFLAIKEFVRYHCLGMVGYEKLMVRLSRNDYEPDVCFFGLTKSKSFGSGQKLFPAPDWIAEVLSNSTEKTDRGIKMQDYALHGVKEYWLVEPGKECIEQYLLKNTTFFLHKIFSRGEAIESPVFEGMHLPVDAVFDEDANVKYRKLFFRE